MAALPKPVIDAMAARAMRLHHTLWHTSRNSWATLNDVQRQVFRDRGWEPPRPARKADGAVERDNGSGEDFLFMHRQMIGTVNGILAERADPGFLHVEGWPAIPAPGDIAFPVPPPFDVPGRPSLSQNIRDAKTDARFTVIRDREARFTDPAVLRTLTLRRLGADLEFGIHNTLHLRWAAQLPEYRGGSEFNVDPRWDEPAYDWLADFYSSHVNPIFWKLHGWVDARIDDWMKANDHTGPVPWSFDPPWSGPEDHGHHLLDLSLHARPGNAEAEALASHTRALEATINDLKANGIPEPTPFPVTT